MLTVRLFFGLNTKLLHIQRDIVHYEDLSIPIYAVQRLPEGPIQKGLDDGIISPHRRYECAKRAH